MNKNFKTDLKKEVETGIKRGIVFTVWYNVKGIPCFLLSEKMENIIKSFFYCLTNVRLYMRSFDLNIYSLSCRTILSLLSLGE